MKNSRYLDWLVTSKCGADMLENKLFPNAKEVTESFGCFNASKHLGDGWEWNRPDISVFVVGDGHRPRTAATFALRSNWNALSIDPLLVNKLYPFKRLELKRAKIEDMPPVHMFGKVLIVMPHSHAKVSDCLARIYGRKRALITLDCCVKNTFDVKPDLEYDDMDIWSPKRTIRIWKNI